MTPGERGVVTSASKLVTAPVKAMSKGVNAQQRQQKEWAETVALVVERTGRRPNPQRPLAEPIAALARMVPTHLSAAAPPGSRRAAISAVVAAMEKNHSGALVPDPSEINVVCAGCAALAALGSGSPANKELVTSLGGIDVVIVAMRAHDGSPQVQEAACAALERLVIGSHDAANAVRTRGGIPTIVAVLRDPRTRTDPGAVREACGALCNLAVNNITLKSAIAREGGITAIVAAMSTHAADPTVLRNACAALWNLAAKSEQNKRCVAPSLVVFPPLSFPRRFFLKNFPNFPDAHWGKTNKQ